MKNCYMDAIETAADTIAWQTKQGTDERMQALRMFVKFISEMYNKDSAIVVADLYIETCNVDEKINA